MILNKHIMHNIMFILSSLFTNGIIFVKCEIKAGLLPITTNFHEWNHGSIKNQSNFFRNFEEFNEVYKSEMKHKQTKAFKLFRVPTDDECLTIDGRRLGTCLNAYECRLRGGDTKGECAMGFGVCCMFLAACNQTVANNRTYILSPSFPDSMHYNLTPCTFEIKVLDVHISQLRVEFNHFSIGQPNRKTGICDNDIFNITGGPSGSFLLCGQNSGQHIYYDIGKANYGRETINDNVTQIKIIMEFSNRLSSIRFWEIRILHVPFSQKAPSGCLQYYTNPEGIVRTFNYAENGRHLANQHYKSCIRQASGMCSIMYQLCDDESFRIGPLISAPSIQNDTFITNNLPAYVPTISPNQSLNYSAESALTDLTTNSALPDIEGSGEEVQLASRKPMSGGFDILSLFRNTFDLNNKFRSTRQFFTTCNDRITMPCIIEDFVGAGMGPIPGCEPVHCGNQFCASGAKPCRIESTVTPFYLGIHFGDGRNKGNAEDNIGACIRYTQIQCM